MGDDYAVPTEGGDAAVRVGGPSHGGWMLDRVRTAGKGLVRCCSTSPSGGRWSAPTSDVVFVHTGACTPAAVRHRRRTDAPPVTGRRSAHLTAVPGVGSEPAVFGARASFAVGEAALDHPRVGR